MSIIAAGTTTTTALSSTGNTDGTLQLQVNGTTPSVTLNTLGAVGVGSTPNFGTAGQALVSAGSTAAPTWASVTTSPAGSNTQIQYNNAGAFGASSALTFDGSTALTLNASAASAQANLRVQTDTTGAVANGYFNINGTDYFRIYTTNSETGLRNLQNTPIYFSTNNTQRFIIGASGQLGIGATPSYGTSGQVLTSGGSGAAPTWSDAPAPAAGKLLASGNINSSTGTVTLTWATTGVKRIRVFLAGASANNSGQIYIQVGHTTSVVSSSNYRFSGQMIQSASITAYSQTTQSQWMVTGGSTQWPVNMVAEIGLGSDGRPCCFATATMTSEPRWFQMGGDFSTTWTTAQFQSVRVWFDGSATYSGRVTVVGYTE